MWDGKEDKIMRRKSLSASQSRQGIYMRNKCKNTKRLKSIPKKNPILYASSSHVDNAIHFFFKLW